MMSFAFKSGALEVVMTVVLLSTLVAGDSLLRQKRQQGDGETNSTEPPGSEIQSSTTTAEPKSGESTTKFSISGTTTVAGSSDKGNQTTEDPFPDCQKCIDAQAKELNETAAANAAANVANKVASELSVEDFDAMQESAKHYCIQQKKCAADRGHLVTPSFYLCIGVLFLQYILF